MGGVLARVLSLATTWPQCVASTSYVSTNGGYARGEGVRGTADAAHAVAAADDPSDDAQYARRLDEMAAGGRRRALQSGVPGEPVLLKKQPPKSPNPPAVDWRQIVDHVRRSNEVVSGTQMLTDTFG